MNDVASSSLPFDRVWFVSALAPGTIGGGSQCSLAFLLATFSIFGQRVHYVGPEFLEIEAESIDLGSYQGFVHAGRLPLHRRLASVGMGFRDRRVAAALVEVGQQDLVILNGEDVGWAAPLLRNRGVSTLMIFHNFAPDYARAERARSLRRWLRAIRFVHCSRLGFLASNYPLCLTRKDLQDYERWSGRRGEFESFHISMPETRCGGPNPPASRVLIEGRYVLLSANFELSQNVRGVRDFLETRWPVWKEQLEGMELVIAGKAADQLNLADAAPGILVFGRQSEDAMQALIRGAIASIAWVDTGSGVKYRVGESLKRGVRVIATQHAALGYEQMPNEALLIVDDDTASSDIREFLDRSVDGPSIASAFDAAYGFEAGVERLGAVIAAARTLRGD